MHILWHSFANEKIKKVFEYTLLHKAYVVFVYAGTFKFMQLAKMELTLLII